MTPINAVNVKQHYLV